MLAGSTDWGVELNIRHARAALTIGIDRLAELRQFAVGADSIDIGAALTLSEVERALAGRVPLLAEMFPQFASRLIRNGATFGGNLGTGSPIGDTPPALLALDASLVLASRDGEREVPLSGYFTGYRQTLKRPDELIKTIRIPTPVAPVSAFHKIAKRRFDDISSVAVGFALRLDAARRRRTRRRRHQDRPGRGRGHPAAGAAHRGVPGRQALVPRRRRGGGRGVERRGHPDQRSPGQRRVPHRDARRVAAEVLRREHRHHPAPGSSRRSDR